jgi:uncharacterized membrane protein HdeD (DUF308 family)
MSTSHVTPAATPAADDNDMAGLVKSAKTSGSLLIVVGILSVGAGVLALVYPGITLLALALITGINLLILGTMGIVDAIASGEADGAARVLAAVLGLLGLIAGLVLIKRPGESLLALVVILGVWFVVSGVIELARLITIPGSRGIRALGGIAEVVLGILILALPDVSLKTVAILAGIAFLFRGALSVVTGVTLRRAAKAAAAT